MRIAINARNRAVVVEGGRIAAPGGAACDVTLDLPDADLRPGLINAHDHLHRNHYGRLGHGRYRNACDWAADIQRRHRSRIAAGRAMPRREALLAGAWKNLFAGVTSVVHHDRWEEDFDRAFPLNVVRIASSDSLGMTPDLDGIDGDARYALHVAEGIDAAAAGEVRALERRGLLTPSLLAVHGVGIAPADAARMRAAGAALVWCPTSNLFLFGRTASRAVLASVDVLLGTDSRLTGAGDLLDELRHARALGMIDDARLEDAVGRTAARRLGLAEPALAPGDPADLVLLRRPLLEARAQDVLLVMVGGAPRVARVDLAPALGALARHGVERTVGSVIRWTSADTVPAREVFHVR